MIPSADVKLVVTTLQVIFNEGNGWMVVKDGYYLVPPDSLYGYAVIGKLHKWRTLWCTGQLFMNLIICRDGTSIIQVEVLKLSKVQNTSSALAWNDTSLVDVMVGLNYYADAFKLEYCIGFLGKRSESTVNDTMLSKRLLWRTLPVSLERLVFQTAFENWWPASSSQETECRFSQCKESWYHQRE